MSAHTDVVGQQMKGGFNPPVRSLMDIDFYKFTMGQLIFKHFRDVDATFTLINRDKSIPLAMIVPQGELEKYLDYARTLSLSSSSGISTDMALLRGMRVYGANMFFEELGGGLYVGDNCACNYFRAFLSEAHGITFSL